MVDIRDGFVVRANEHFFVGFHKIDLKISQIHLEETNEQI